MADFKQRRQRIDDEHTARQRARLAAAHLAQAVNEIVRGATELRYAATKLADDPAYAPEVQANALLSIAGDLEVAAGHAENVFASVHQRAVEPIL